MKYQRLFLIIGVTGFINSTPVVPQTLSGEARFGEEIGGVASERGGGKKGPLVSRCSIPRECTATTNTTNCCNAKRDCLANANTTRASCEAGAAVIREGNKNTCAQFYVEGTDEYNGCIAYGDLAYFDALAICTSVYAAAEARCQASYDACMRSACSTPGK